MFDLEDTVRESLVDAPWARAILGSVRIVVLLCYFLEYCLLRYLSRFVALCACPVLKLLAHLEDL